MCDVSIVATSSRAINSIIHGCIFVPNPCAISIHTSY